MLAFLLAANVSAGDVPGDMPSARFDSLVQDFGEVPKGTVVEQVFRLTNAGTAELRIESVQLSMPGMNIRVKQTIPAGETVEARITWDTAHYVREVEGRAELSLNDPDRPRVSLTLTGTVLPPIDILPRPDVYMCQFVGERAVRSLTIRSNQKRPFHIVRLEPRGSHFQATYKAAETGKSYALTVTVPPESPVGRYRESVVVHTDDPERPRIGIDVNILVKPDVFVSVDTIDFGEINLSDIRRNPGIVDFLRQTFVINRKHGEMSITAIESDIRILDMSADPATPSNAFKIEVGLKPAEMKTGAFEGSIVIKTSDPDHAKLVVPVKGVVLDRK